MLFDEGGKQGVFHRQQLAENRRARAGFASRVYRTPPGHSPYFDASINCRSTRFVLQQFARGAPARRRRSCRSRSGAMPSLMACLIDSTCAVSMSAEPDAARLRKCCDRPDRLTLASPEPLELVCGASARGLRAAVRGRRVALLRAGHGIFQRRRIRLGLGIDFHDWLPLRFDSDNGKRRSKL